MKVTIEGRAFFNANQLKDTIDEAFREAGPGFDAEALDDSRGAPVELVGHPSENLDHGQVLLIHPKVSLELNVDDLERALRVFRRGYGPR